MAILNFAEKVYGWLILAGNLLQPVLILILRLTWGWQFFVTGKGKLLNHPDIVDFFTSLGIPFPDLNAWFVGGLECFGGLMLMAGLASRPLSLMLSVNMMVAFMSVSDERAKLFNAMNDLDSFTQADPFLFMLVSLIVFAFGPGVLSVDYLVGKYVVKKKPESSQDTAA